MSKKINEDKVLSEIRKRRHPSYSTKADIKRIAKAHETDDWNEVKASRLYNKHSPEYCELLELIYAEEH